MRRNHRRGKHLLPVTVISMYTIVTITLYWSLSEVSCHDAGKSGKETGNSDDEPGHSYLDDYRYLLCRKCGHSIASVEQLFNGASKRCTDRYNTSILGLDGVLVQTFTNPNGVEFGVVTARHADVYAQDETFSAHTWFPGYQWSISACPMCGQHVGWKFKSKKKKSSKLNYFHALIYNRLIEEHHADSLVIMPKDLRS